MIKERLLFGATLVGLAACSGDKTESSEVDFLAAAINSPLEYDVVGACPGASPSFYVEYLDMDGVHVLRLDVVSQTSHEWSIPVPRILSSRPSAVPDCASNEPILSRPTPVRDYEPQGVVFQRESDGILALHGSCSGWSVRHGLIIVQDRVAEMVAAVEDSCLEGCDYDAIFFDGGADPLCLLHAGFTYDDVLEYNPTRMGFVARDPDVSSRWGYVQYGPGGAQPMMVFDEPTPRGGELLSYSFVPDRHAVLLKFEDPDRIVLYESDGAGAGLRHEIPHLLDVFGRGVLRVLGVAPGMYALDGVVREGVLPTDGPAILLVNADFTVRGWAPLWSYADRVVGHGDHLHVATATDCSSSSERRLCYWVRRGEIHPL